VRALIERARHGASVILLLPGHRIDHRSVPVISHRLFDPLLAAGVRIFEYQPTMLHQKLLVVDRQFAVIGTTNINVLSFEYLDEINIAVRDGAFARAAQEQQEADVADSLELQRTAWRGRAWEAALAEAVWMAAERWVRRLGTR
jgi:cardiolipin synthase